MVENNKIKKTEHNFRDFFLRPILELDKKHIDTLTQTSLFLWLYFNIM